MNAPPPTMMALHIMAFHPHPHKRVLLPLMGINIAQLCHTWIASSLISGCPFHDHLSHTFLLCAHNDTPHSSTMQSDPFNIMPWSDESLTIPDDATSKVSITLGSPTSLTSTNIFEVPNSTIIPHCIYAPQPSTSRETLMFPQLSDRTSNSSSPPLIMPVHEVIVDIPDRTKLVQTKITNWNNHRPFYTGIPHKNNSPDSADIESQLPTGSVKPLIEPTKTLRILMQNPQYSLQLTNENSNMMQLSHQLKELSTSIYVATTPNIN
jgi:hypothetical protein